MEWTPASGFHATRRLTLNLGLRVSLFGTYYERYHQAYNFDPTAWNVTKAPQVDDVNGTLTGQPGAIVPSTGDAFNGMVQCGVNGIPSGSREIGCPPSNALIESISRRSESKPPSDMPDRIRDRFRKMFPFLGIRKKLKMQLLETASDVV